MTKDIRKEKHEKDLFKLIDKKLKNNVNSFICTNGTGTGKTPAINYLISKFKNKKIAIITPLRHTSFNGGDTFTYTKFGMEEYLDIFKKYQIFIFDEAHHALSDKCIITLDKLKKLKKKLFGFTADPERSDGLNTIDEFGGDKNNLITCLWEDGVENGIFKKPNYIYTTYKIPKTKGTNRQSLGSKSLQKTFKRWVSKNKKIIVFASNEKHLELIMSQTVRLFNKYKLKPFIYTHSHQDSHTKKIFDSFRKATSTGYVCFTINKFIEGYHINNVDCIMVFRSTKSKRIVNQIRGRIANYNQKKIPTIIDCCSMYKLFGEDSFILPKNQLKPNHNNPLYTQYICCDYDEIQQDILEYIRSHNLKYYYNGILVSCNTIAKMHNLNPKTLGSWLRFNKIVNITDELINKYKDIHKNYKESRPDITLAKEIKKMLLPFHGSYMHFRDTYIKKNKMPITIESARKYIEEICIPKLNFIKLRKDIKRKGLNVKNYLQWCKTYKKDIYTSFDDYKSSIEKTFIKYNRHTFKSINELCRYLKIQPGLLGRDMKKHRMSLKEAINKQLEYKKTGNRKVINLPKRYEFVYKGKKYKSKQHFCREFGLKDSSVRSMCKDRGISYEKAISIQLKRKKEAKCYKKNH